VKFFKCQVCLETSNTTAVRKVKAPSLYAFNHEVILDIFYTHDMNDPPGLYGWLSVVCNGTTFHMICMISVGKGNPLSIKCYKKFQSHWTRWAGFPQFLVCDRGLHNRGEFARGLKANGTHIRQAALEAPEQIGRGERHGGIMKNLMKTTIKEHHVVGKDQMKQVGYIAQETKNDMSKRGGFSASQWVTCRYPRRPGSMLEEDEWGQLGVLQSQQDPATAFGIKAGMRATMQKQMVKVDCGRRYAAALLRNARAVSKDYEAGNMIMYRCIQASSGAPGDDWHGPARIIGFEKDVVWIQHGAVPVATAMHLMRPASTAELLAWQIKSRTGKVGMIPEVPPTEDQASYLDHTGENKSQQIGKDQNHAPTSIIPRENRLPPQPASAAIDEEEWPPFSDEDDEEPPFSMDVDTAATELQRSVLPMLSPTTRVPDEQEEITTPLERHLERTGHSSEDPGVRLARKLASKSKSAASSSRARSRSRGETDESMVAHFHEQRGDQPLQEALHEFHEYQAFFAERIPREDAKAFKASVDKAAKKKSLEKRGKLLVYQKLDKAHQVLLDASRLKEWDNYLKFGAVKVISKKEAEDLVYSGAEELPTQWIETDKNEFLRNESNPDMDPLMKSRLVARGDLSHIFSRSDSPTAEKEGIFIILSFAASRRLKINCGDLDHGYFQGERLSKPLILRQPKGGLPDKLIKFDDRLLAFVPIYGTKDAGRGLWRRIRRILLKHGFTENMILSALYAFSKDGIILVLLGTHVDDILWACEPEVEELMNSIYKELILGKQEEWSFRFCGIEICQNKETYSIRITCEQTTRKLMPIAISPERLSQLETDCTNDERAELWSVVGSLMWISRSCRPGISYRVSTLQSVCRNPVVSDLQTANTMVQHSRRHPSVGSPTIQELLGQKFPLPR